MSARTPTCVACGAKFPGDPCKTCGAPAGMAAKDVPAFKRAQLLDELAARGASKRERRAALRRRPSTGNRKRIKHGR